MNLRRRGAVWRLALLCAFFLGAYPHGAGLANGIGMMGVPATAIISGQAYEFTPIPVVFGTEVARFSIENLPSWAAFDALNGRLYGTPTENDVGLWSEIRISITDGVLTASLLPFAISVQPALNVPPPIWRSVSLSWIPPTENTDGSALVDLAAYRIYSGTAITTLEPLVTLSHPGLTRYVIENAPVELRFFAITAINSQGEESDFSGVVEQRPWQ